MKHETLHEALRDFSPRAPKGPVILVSFPFPRLCNCWLNTTTIKTWATKNKTPSWYIYKPGTQMTSIFEGQPPKQGLFQSKQGSFGF